MFLVLGAVTVVGPDGQVVALSDRQRSLLASLLARAGEVDCSRCILAEDGMVIDF